ncbi:MAG: hypothetical protein ABJF01_22175 [bacterium]
MPAELLVLRLIHVLGGMVWVGAGVFTTFFLAPALATPGINAGQVFAALQKRRLFTALPLVAVLTILSGLRLIWIDSGGLSSRYFASASGMTFGLSGVAAIGAFLLSLIVTRPTAVRAAKLGAAVASAPAAERPQLSADVARLRRMSALAGSAAMALILAGAAGMAVARYLA